MITIDVHNIEGDKVAQAELREGIFDVPVKKHILHQVVVSQLLAKRAGTASTKGRSEIRASKSKLWRQKGTGRARVGASSSPTRRGGGVAFGPAPRQYVRKVSRKVRKAALRMALADKARSERLVVLDEFALPEIKTKGFVRAMQNFDVGKTLIVTEGKNENLERSSRNVPWVKVMRVEGLNVYDVLNHDHLFLVQAVIPKIEEALAP
jgi:large subunit ribosomal protein L4